jgi:hypothetical protein
MTERKIKTGTGFIQSLANDTRFSLSRGDLPWQHAPSLVLTEPQSAVARPQTTPSQSSDQHDVQNTYPFFSFAHLTGINRLITLSSSKSKSCGMLIRDRAN